MGSRPHLRPGAWATITFGLTVGLLGSCAPGSDEPVAGADLLAPANAPRLLVEKEEISPAEPVFFGGFLAAERAERESPTRRLGDEPGQILISFVDFEPRRRRLGLEMRAAGDTSVTIRLGFDGEPLAVIDQGPRWTRHLVELPAERCGFGQHALELDPLSPTLGPRPDAGRPLLRLRRLWVEPATTATGEPQLDSRGLVLPPGTAASWAFWVPPGGRLRASWEGGGVALGATPFVVLDDDGSPRPLSTLDLSPLSGEPIRLAAAVPAGAEGPLRLRDLVLVQPRSSVSEAAPAPGQGKSLLVVGELSEGFPITPCTTDSDRALRCLLSGQEEAAFGLPVDAAFDHVGREPDAVAAFLEAAPAPATAALVVRADRARVHAERIRRQVDGLEVLMANLPRSPADLTVLAATLDANRPPINARDVDLAATALAAAGIEAPHLDGLDLRPALSRQVSPAVRPVAPLWLDDRSVAVTEGGRFELSIGDPRGARSTLEACALSYLRRRRAALLWAGGDRTAR